MKPSIKDLMKQGLRNARFEAQRRTDEAGLIDEPAEPVVYKGRRASREKSLAQDMRDIKRGIFEDD